MKILTCFVITNNYIPYEKGSLHVTEMSRIYVHSTELKKIANLANQVQGTLWESGEHFDQILTLFYQIFESVAIYALSLPFSCLMG